MRDLSILDQQSLLFILGDPRLQQDLILRLEPLVKARVARTLRKYGLLSPTELEDASQEVMLALFEQNARALRAWNPERGLSLTGFVQLVTRRVALSRLKQGWLIRAQQPLESCEERAADSVLRPDRRLFSQRELTRLLEQLRSEVSDRGVELFRALFVEQQPLAQVCREFGMQPDAVYAWRSRLSKRVRAIHAEQTPSSQRA